MESNILSNGNSEDSGSLNSKKKEGIEVKNEVEKIEDITQVISTIKTYIQNLKTNDNIYDETILGEKIHVFLLKSKISKIYIAFINGPYKKRHDILKANISPSFGVFEFLLTCKDITPHYYTYYDGKFTKFVPIQKIEKVNPDGMYSVVMVSEQITNREVSVYYIDDFQIPWQGTTIGNYNKNGFCLINLAHVNFRETDIYNKCESLKTLPRIEKGVKPTVIGIKGVIADELAHHEQNYSAISKLDYKTITYKGNQYFENGDQIKQFLSELAHLLEDRRHIADILYMSLTSFDISYNKTQKRYSVKINLMEDYDPTYQLIIDFLLSKTGFNLPGVIINKYKLNEQKIKENKANIQLPHKGCIDIMNQILPLINENILCELEQKMLGFATEINNQISKTKK